MRGTNFDFMSSADMSNKNSGAHHLCITLYFERIIQNIHTNGFVSEYDCKNSGFRPELGDKLLLLAILSQRS